MLQLNGRRRPVLVVICCVFCLQATLEAQVLDEKAKAQRLQTELDVSEQVQKDFVKLSQTLQVIIYTCIYGKGVRKPLMKMSELQRFLLCQKWTSPMLQHFMSETFLKLFFNHCVCNFTRFSWNESVRLILWSESESS